MVNDKYQSEYFIVNTQLPNEVIEHQDIYVSGLRFFDNTYTVSWRKKIGKPDMFFGLEYCKNTTPLYFDYLSSEAITSFKAIKIDNNGNSVY